MPRRAAGMDDEVVIGDGGNRYWYNQLTNEEILGPPPEPPTFPEDIALVRDRVRKMIGKVSVTRVMTIQDPAIARLIAQDEVRRQKADVFLGQAGLRQHVEQRRCGFSMRDLLLRQSVAANRR